MENVRDGAGKAGVCILAWDIVKSSPEMANESTPSWKQKPMRMSIRMGSGAERSIMVRDQEIERPEVKDDQCSYKPSAAERQ